MHPRTQAGLPAKLTWERSNKYDDLAIRIEVQGVKVGYCPRGTEQRLLHSARRAGRTIHASVAAYNRTNPTWHMLSIKVECAPVAQYIPQDVPFEQDYEDIDY